MMPRLVLAAVLAAVSAAAVDIGTLKPEGYVTDFARVVDAQSKAELTAYCAQVEKAAGVQMAFVTISTIGQDPVEDFANDLYRRWGIGNKETHEGLLLLLVVNDRRSRLEVGRGLEPYITDGTSGALLRQMRPALQQRRYGEALLAAAQSLGERVAAAKGVQIAADSPMRRRPPPPPAADFHIPLPMLILGAFAFFWIMGMGSRQRRGYRGGGLLPGIILGNMMGRSSYGGYSRGGFGGYDSGDSFGGFGGGDSGGGGASSDW